MNAELIDPELVRFYRQRISEHGLSYQAMWGDVAAWKSAERFQPLLQLPIQDGDTLVDIGCGTGDLGQFLAAHGRKLRYVGIEAVPEFAAHARTATGAEILEADAFGQPEAIIEADWYVTFGTLNKSWSVRHLPGESDKERILGLIERLFAKARKGVAVSLTTDVVDRFKPGTVNIDPAEVAGRMKCWTPHFSVFHGYSFYEFYAAAWRAARR